MLHHALYCWCLVSKSYRTRIKWQESSSDRTQSQFLSYAQFIILHPSASSSSYSTISDTMFVSVTSLLLILVSGNLCGDSPPHRVLPESHDVTYCTYCHNRTFSELYQRRIQLAMPFSEIRYKRFCRKKWSEKRCELCYFFVHVACVGGKAKENKVYHFFPCLQVLTNPLAWRKNWVSPNFYGQFSGPRF